ncbi:hypothetical protein EON79_02515 [bacterium]|nr:MAG: hypothetical protein EON79_02515 [bacterium]
MEVRDDVLSAEARPATQFGWKGAFGLVIWALAILFAAWSGGGSFDWTDKSAVAAPLATQMDGLVLTQK